MPFSAGIIACRFVRWRERMLAAVVREGGTGRDAAIRPKRALGIRPNLVGKAPINGRWPEPSEQLRLPHWRFGRGQPELPFSVLESSHSAIIGEAIKSYPRVETSFLLSYKLRMLNYPSDYV